MNLNSNNSDAISVSYQIPLVLCAVCTGKEKVSFLSLFFLFNFLSGACICGGGITLLHSVTQKHTYLKIIVWCALCFEVLSVLDDKKCDTLKNK